MCVGELKLNGFGNGYFVDLVKSDLSQCSTARLKSGRPHDKISPPPAVPQVTLQPLLNLNVGENVCLHCKNMLDEFDKCSEIGDVPLPIQRVSMQVDVLVSFSQLWYSVYDL